MMSPTVSLDPDRNGDGYAATKATNGKRDSRDPVNYWLGKYNRAADLVLDLGSTVMVHTIYIRNSYNGGYHYSTGSKGLKIMIGNSNTGPWMEFDSGELENPIPYGTAGDIIPMIEFKGNSMMQGRYVKYECLTWYGYGCSLQYIGVAQAVGG